jgi:hypothetical protein
MQDALQSTAVSGSTLGISAIDHNALTSQDDMFSHLSFSPDSQFLFGTPEWSIPLVSISLAIAREYCQTYELDKGLGEVHVKLSQIGSRFNNIQWCGYYL